MNALPAPTPLQLDALRELANVGVGQAATALSRLLGGRRVGLSVPRAEVLPLREVPSLLGGPHAPLVAVRLGMSGQLAGQLLMALGERDARRLAEALLGTPVRGPLSAEACSALAEVANILASACLSAISRLTSLRLLPSPPTLEQDEAQAVVSRTLVADARGGATAVVMEARFLLEDVPGVEGQLLILPDGASLRTLLTRLGV